MGTRLAHSSTERDYIIPDKFDPSSNLANTKSPLPRNSEDKVPSDNRGKEVLDLCKSLGFVILNGRKIGDSFGKYTCFQWNGSSVVDYVIVCQTLYNDISFLKIRKFIPWISDH